MFYNSNILHCAMYDPDERRATLHACMGNSRGGTTRARNILQHGLEWMKEERFKTTLPTVSNTIARNASRFMTVLSHHATNSYILLRVFQNLPLDSTMISPINSIILTDSTFLLCKAAGLIALWCPSLSTLGGRMFHLFFTTYLLVSYYY